ncbi:MAG: LamG-like jellyroll fold domain-containing protein [Bacteroidota bacterium]
MKKLLYLLLLFAGAAYGQTAEVIAHRGGSALAPENTLAAFSNAIELNADYFELDVMMSSDDSLVIMHDATVDRTTDGTGSVSNLSYAQLKALDAGSWFSSKFAGERVPTLFEALNLAKTSGTDIKVVIELKSSESDLVTKVVALVQKLQMEPRVIIASFNINQITASKAADPTIRVMLFGTITTAMIDQVKAIFGEWVGSGGAITQELLDYAHGLNVKFNAWTINSATQMQPLIDMGIDAITTDYPDVMIALMDDTPPSDVVLTAAIASETLVTLSWDAATDEESGVTGYEIYRDETAGATTLLAKVGKVTTYNDQTYTELKQYFYRVRAINLAGMTSVNYSNELDVTTGADVTKPTLVYISSFGDSTTVTVGFSERVDKTTAETMTNYAINYGIVVSGAVLLDDQKSVVLTTSKMLEQPYLLTVKNVKDLAATPNTIATVSKVFLHKAIHEDAVAIFQMDEIKAVDADLLAVDETVNHNDGTVLNGVSLDEGILGYGYHFNGTDGHVKLPVSSSLDMGGNGVTISLWTKLDYLPVDLPGAYGPLFDSDNDQYVLYEDRANSELRFKVSTSGGAERPGIPNADLETGKWIHICGVYDGTTARIYLNGMLKDSHNLTGTVKTGQAGYIGRNGTTDIYFSGSMDQVEVYNRGLSEAEVLDKYLNTKAPAIELNPSDVSIESSSVNGTDVTLTWSEPVNYESNIMGYEIYRDLLPDATTLYTTVGNVNTFTDKTNMGNTTFYYRVKAKNTRGLKSPDYSNEVSVSTAEDIVRPIIMYATSHVEADKVIIEYSEKVDRTTAEDVANYALDQGVTVSAAMLGSDEKTVLLTTSAMNEATYQLTVNHVKDLATPANVILPDFKVSFVHRNLSADLIAAYDLNDLPVIGNDTIVYDLTEYNNDGLAHNLPVVGEGYLGNSLVLNGNNKQYVQFQSSPSFDINDSKVTISVWTKLTYLPVEMPVAYGPLYDSDGDQYVIYADKGNKELRFKTATTVSAERPGIPNDDLITGQWIHVVGVYDGETAKIYLNGVLKDSHNLTGTVKTGQVPMLGKSGVTGTPAYFTGSIDQVEVYKTALTEAQVLELFSTTKEKAQYNCEPYNVTEDVTICPGESYTFPDGTSASEATTHVSNLLSMYGCDSLITTNLSIQSVDITISEDQGVLSVTSGGDEFQWIDCDNGNTEINGATSASYTATTTGNYAVRVSLNGCENISNCVYTVVSSTGSSKADHLILYPNPNSGRFTIDLQDLDLEGGKLEIFNIQGQLIHSELLDGNTRIEVTLPEGSSGICLVKISSDQTLRIKQMVVY